MADSSNKLRNDPNFWIALCSIAFLVFIIALVVVDSNKPKNSETYEEDYLPGQPLDAVKMSSPSFSGSDYCYKVCDRTSGACWWLLKMDNEWHVLQICNGSSYVKQQQEEK